jgi:serine/threonine protein kinase
MEQYQPIQRLGSGACANIYLVRRVTDGAVFVAKRVDLGHINTDFAMKEVRALSRLRSHPHITQYHTHYVQGNELIIIMEYADGGDLAKLMRARHELSASLQQAESMEGQVFGGIFAVPAPRTGFTEGEVLYLFRQVCEAVSFLHRNNIVHRDLKPANIFLTRDGRVKVGDLGVCKQVEHAYDWARTRIGTPLYMAPEIWNGLPYDFKGDVWALGCLLYELTTGRLAFTAPAQILHNQIRPLPVRVPEGLARLIRWMLTADPNTRPTMEEVLAEVRTMERAAHPQEAPPISPALPLGTPVCTTQPVVESPAASPAAVNGVAAAAGAGSSAPTPRSGAASAASSAARSRASFPVVRPRADAPVAAEYPAVNIVGSSASAAAADVPPQSQQQGVHFYAAAPQQQFVYQPQQQYYAPYGHAAFGVHHPHAPGCVHHHPGYFYQQPATFGNGFGVAGGGNYAVAYVDSVDSDAGSDVAYGMPVVAQPQQQYVCAAMPQRWVGASSYVTPGGAVFVA